MSEYAGESIAKKVARLRLYRRVKQVMDSVGTSTRDMRMMILIGDEACEVGCIKHLLNVKPEGVIAVDRNPEACKMLSRRWPEVQVINADLESKKTFTTVRSWLKNAPGLDFIHLDLMGNMSNSATALYGIWLEFLSSNGLMGVTYLRARENEKNMSHMLVTLRQASKALIPSMKNTPELKRMHRLMGADSERAHWHLTAMKTAHLITHFIKEYKDSEEANHHMVEWLKEWQTVLRLGNHREVQHWMELYDNPTITPMATFSYRSEVSPMGVLLVQKVERELLKSQGFENLQYSGGRFSCSVIKKDPMLDLLAEAESLHKIMDWDAAAECLNVAPRTLVAWRAHRTMGTYA